MPFLGPYKLLASVPRPHTTINSMSWLRGAPSVYNRAPIFFRVPGPPNLYFNHCTGVSRLRHCLELLVKSIILIFATIDDRVRSEGRVTGLKASNLGRVTDQ